MSTEAKSKEMFMAGGSTLQSHTGMGYPLDNGAAANGAEISPSQTAP